MFFSKSHRHSFYKEGGQQGTNAGTRYWYGTRLFLLPEAPTPFIVVKSGPITWPIYERGATIFINFKSYFWAVYCTGSYKSTLLLPYNHSPIPCETKVQKFCRLTLISKTNLVNFVKFQRNLTT